MYKSSAFSLILRACFNAKKTNGAYRINENDIISIASFLLNNEKNSYESNKSLQMSNKKEAKTKKLEVIFQNKHLLIINKPYGINVQPSQNDSTSISQIIKESIPIDNLSISFTPAPLHRLDKRTTGALVISKSLEGAKWFSFAIKEHLIKKIYIGIAKGILKEKCFWCDYIKEDTDKMQTSFHKQEISSLENPQTQKAITYAYPLAYGSINGIDVTLTQYTIETGRKHQIRAQTAFHSFPLLGDSAYDKTILSKAKDQRQNHEFYLHAIALIFPKDNPIKMPEIVYAPIQEEFKKTLNSNLIKWNGKLIL